MRALRTSGNFASSRHPPGWPGFFPIAAANPRAGVLSLPSRPRNSSRRHRRRLCCGRCGPRVQASSPYPASTSPVTGTFTALSDLCNSSQHSIGMNLLAVGITARKRNSGRGGRDRRKARFFDDAGARDVPHIDQEQRVRSIVHGSKCFGLFLLLEIRCGQLVLQRLHLFDELGNADYCAAHGAAPDLPRRRRGPSRAGYRSGRRRIRARLRP